MTRTDSDGRRTDPGGGAAGGGLDYVRDGLGADLVDDDLLAIYIVV